MNIVPHQIGILVGFRRALILGETVWLHSPVILVIKWQVDQMTERKDTRHWACLRDVAFRATGKRFLKVITDSSKRRVGESQGRGLIAPGRLSSTLASRPPRTNIIFRGASSHASEHPWTQMGTPGAWGLGSGVACSYLSAINPYQLTAQQAPSHRDPGTQAKLISLKPLDLYVILYHSSASISWQFSHMTLLVAREAGKWVFYLGVLVLI